VFGSAGVVASDNNTANRVYVGDTSGIHGALPLYFFLERYTDSYINEMKAFIHAVEKDETPPVVGMDGRIPVVIGLAAWKSVRENRPVKVSEIK
jgi:myo-inositol 2-dehydrogenase/D-chiro-inositol 1-dehydrogenase